MALAKINVPSSLKDYIELSSNSGNITYGTPVNITVTKHTGNALSVNSSASEYVEATISGNTITLTMKKYSPSPIAITVNTLRSNQIIAQNVYFATTTRATGTLNINKTSLSLTPSAPSGTVTVTTNSNGTITATPADNAVCSATVSGTTVTIEGSSNGETTVTIAVAQSDQYTAPSSKTISVTVNVYPNNIFDISATSTLAKLKSVISAGNAANYFKAGDYFDITFQSDITLDSGSIIEADSTWRVVCLGIDHNSSKEGTNRGHFCIGKTTDGKEICFYGKKMNSTGTNVGGWNGCAMKTWLNETFYNTLPTDLQNVITECTKYTDNTGNASNTSGNVTATSQKIWLLAEFEVSGNRSKANQYEQNSQAQYDYYKNGNSILRYNHASQNTKVDWWLRSPYYNDGKHFCYVIYQGYISYTGIGAIMDAGAVPCFTIS